MTMRLSAANEITIVIPALCESVRIPGLLGDIAAHAPHTPVVVVDNMSDDDGATVRAVEACMGEGPGKLPHLKLVSATKGQGPAYARNEGAEHVQTPWIFFVDADARLQQTSPEAIVQEMKLRALDVATCRFVPDTDRLLDRTILGAITVLMKSFELTSSPVGMGSGIVVSTAVHQRHPFKHAPIYEDVEYLREIVRSGYTCRTLDARGTEVTFCMRRFERKGYLYQLLEYARHGLTYLSTGRISEKIIYEMGGKDEGGSF